MKRLTVVLLCLAALLLLAACGSSKNHSSAVVISEFDRQAAYNEGYNAGYRDGYTAGSGGNESEPTSTAANSADYVLNTNTKKFHYPDCSSVQQMSEKNKRYFTGSRDEVIKMGYKPCKNCKP